MQQPSPVESRAADIRRDLVLVSLAVVCSDDQRGRPLHCLHGRTRHSLDVEIPFAIVEQYDHMAPSPSGVIDRPRSCPPNCFFEAIHVFLAFFCR